jgi:3-methyl-2-oxobutanoate hydroxymethyltransferase
MVLVWQVHALTGKASSHVPLAEGGRVGDSVGTVLHGFSDTLGVTLEMMILHEKAVRRGPSRTLMVVNMPFGSDAASPQDAFGTAPRLTAETGCAAEKLEGGAHIAESIRFLVDRGMPVMAHVGLTPQSVHAVGGHEVQGQRGADGLVLEGALAAAQSGAFAIVLEKVPEGLARNVTERDLVPTTRIGASVAGDGQILVVDDMLGLSTDFRPTFMRHVFSDDAVPSLHGKAT